MKSLIVFFFIASVNIFGMEQKEETGVPLDPLFSESFLLDTINQPEMARDEFISKDRFDSSPETSLFWNASAEKNDQQVLPARDNDIKIIAQNPTMRKTDSTSLADRGGKRHRYVQEMVAAIEQDEKRLKQEAQKMGKEKESLKKNHTKQNEHSPQSSKRKYRYRLYNSATSQEIVLVASALQARINKTAQHVQERKLKALEMPTKSVDSVQSRCSKCGCFFFRLYTHLAVSSCGNSIT